MRQVACTFTSLLLCFSIAAQTRVLKRFSAIEAIDHRTDYDLVITDRGLPGTVQIEGPKDAVGLVTSSVREGVLYIAAEPTRNFLPDIPFFDARLEVRHKIKITVSCRGLTRIKTEGSGTLSANNFRFRDLSINALGDSKVDFSKCEFYSLETDLSGSSRAQFLNSEAVDVRLKIQGDGAVDAHTLRTKNLDARIFGAGRITAYPRELLKARVTGKGEILYRGNPSSLEKEVTEGGRVEKYLDVGLQNLE